MVDVSQLLDITNIRKTLFFYRLCSNLYFTDVYIGFGVYIDVRKVILTTQLIKKNLIIEQRKTLFDVVNVGILVTLPFELKLTWRLDCV